MRFIPVLHTTILLLGSVLAYAQHGNCDNAGFELGTAEGYQTFTGIITAAGEVIIETPQISAEQHRIMHIDEGFDPIAAEFCELNKELPVVPAGAGNYAMRLGNAITGAKAERVLLQFRVTPERSFFLLSYAVVLNDPGHDDYEQPRFELRILSSSGQILDCGEYQVRAGENIEGFENCGNWRVHPWTTAGFELQSYLGQDIQIELMTSDCARGGHSGYAYFDASCRPLEIELNGYCPGSTSARLVATEGFEEYQWNTGETTNAITLPNPGAGTAYSVTVTSATGCTLVLSDTLPPLEEVLPPVFDPLPDTTICVGEPFWVHPSGANLPSIFSSTLGYSADSFLLSPTATTTYQFTAIDVLGCAADTLSFTVNVDSISTTLVIDQAVIDSITCVDAADGAIELRSNATSYAWANGGTSPRINNLPAGSYPVRLHDAFGCFLDLEYAVPAPLPVVIGEPEVQSPLCFGGAGGSITVQPQGGTPPYTWQGGAAAGARLVLNNRTSGVHALVVTDKYGCTAFGTAFIPEPTPLTAGIAAEGDFVDNARSLCTGSPLQLTALASKPLIRTLWESPQEIPCDSCIELSFTPTDSAYYQLVVEDVDGCLDTTTISIPINRTLSEIIFTPPSAAGDSNLICFGSEVTLQVAAEPPVASLQWDPAPQLSCLDCPEARVRPTLSTRYRATVQHENGCISTPERLLPVSDPSCSLYIPTAFSPNKDGLNDRFWIPSSLSIATILRLEIFDRYGGQLYSVTDVPLADDDRGWDGQARGLPAPPGVYVYFFEVEYFDGSRGMLEGSVTLLR